MKTLLALGALALLVQDSLLDFSKPELPADWRTPKGWKVDAGELRGEGGGFLECTRAIAGDFTLSFEAWTEEKANVEVKLTDAKASRDLYTFAFLGRYHPVLDGVKTAMLRGDAFVNVTSKLWIFPGRKFTFEVRRARHQYQMFLNGELGPFFVDEAPPKETDDARLRILFAPEGAKDHVRFDNVRLVTK